MRSSLRRAAAHAGSREPALRGTLATVDSRYDRPVPVPPSPARPRPLARTPWLQAARAARPLRRSPGLTESLPHARTAGIITAGAQYRSSGKIGHRRADLLDALRVPARPTPAPPAPCAVCMVDGVWLCSSSPQHECSSPKDSVSALFGNTARSFIWISPLLCVAGRRWRRRRGGRGDAGRVRARAAATLSVCPPSRAPRGRGSRWACDSRGAHQTHVFFGDVLF